MNSGGGCGGSDIGAGGRLPLDLPAGQADIETPVHILEGRPKRPLVFFFFFNYL